MKQLRQVVMLPTEKASNLWKHKKEDRLGYSNGTTIEDSLVIPQHLYITSNEEIKEGDWCITNGGNNRIGVDKYQSTIQYTIKPLKIIATTDKSLLINITKKSSDGIKYKHLPVYFPAIPESFIKAFVESNGTIKEVLVEYEERWKDLGDRGDGKHIYETNHLVLKTRPDNTIIISQAKMYSRDEVINLISQHSIWKISNPRGDIDKWIKDNL